MNRSVVDICRQFQGNLIVSCQAPEGDPFRDSGSIARFARAAVEGGAVGIRADGAEDVRAIRQAVRVPIIGIAKQPQSDGRTLITPSFEAARELVGAGADMIALECTCRGQRYGALERLWRIKSELGVPVGADIATAEEAIAVEKAGADLVLTTLRGYTHDTEHIKSFEPAFIAELVRLLNVPVLAEGRIETPEQARQALAAGAHAVVVGTAITGPQEIARRFAQTLARQRTFAETARYFIGIDLGGTNTKSGIVSREGDLACESAVPTPSRGGRDALLSHLKEVAARCAGLARRAGISPGAVGVATAGWVDPDRGAVAYATANLPGWTGTRIADELEAAVGLPVAVENDANALAVAEKHFGLARELKDFVCITLGTGVGGGCYVGGRLNRGAHFFANGLGHINIQPDGLPCTCGQRGCLEVYANAAALLRYAGETAFRSAEEVISGANSGNPVAQSAIRTYASYLARGCASMIHLLDPEMLLLSGGIAQNNAYLLARLEEELSRLVPAWEARHLLIRASPLAYYGGVLGAAAVALEKMSEL